MIKTILYIYDWQVFVGFLLLFKNKTEVFIVLGVRLCQIFFSPGKCSLRTLSDFFFSWEM